MSSLPIPSSLEAFLASVRSLQSAADNVNNPPGGQQHLQQQGAVVNPGQLGMGELSEFASRSLDMLQRAPLANLLGAMDSLDGAQNSLGVAVVSRAANDCFVAFNHDVAVAALDGGAAAARQHPRLGRGLQPRRRLHRQLQRGADPLRAGLLRRDVPHLRRRAGEEEGRPRGSR
jgi:hypothetical protein